MGVKACGRDGCRNIMCDRFVLDCEDRRYICDDCFGELCEYRATWPEEMTAAEVRQNIVEFMESYVGTYKSLGKVDVEAEFRRLTGQD